MKLDNDDLEEIFDINRFYDKCYGSYRPKAGITCNDGKIFVDKVVGLTPKGKPKHKTITENCPECNGTGRVMNNLGYKLKEFLIALRETGVFNG